MRDRAAAGIASRALMHEVEQHLLDLHRVGAHRAAPRVDSVLQLEVVGSAERSSCADSATSAASEPSARRSPRWPRLNVSICAIRSRARSRRRAPAPS